MAITSYISPGSGSRLAGDARDLAYQLGSPRELAELGFALSPPLSADISDLASLRQFLAAYVDRVLIPIELPVVRRVFEHARRHEIAELIAVDQAYGPLALPESMVEASRRVGRSHLRRLRPLRGERRVQRYWRAVQRGEAHAWHTVVYGLVLAVYSLPLHQGLVSFGCQTVHGFVRSSCGRLRLAPAAGVALEEELGTLVAPAVEGLLRCADGPQLLAT